MQPIDWGLKEVDGRLEDRSGGSWENLAEFLETEVIGLCGCGDENKCLWVVDMLKCCKREENGGRYPEDALTEYVAAHPTRAAHILLHYMNERDLIEHGSCVGGDWPTSTGEAVMEFFAEQTKGND